MALEFASLVPHANALAPPPSRRAFLSKATASAAAKVVIASPAFAKDQYSLDVEETEIPKKSSKEGGKGGLIVGGALAGGFALSLPLFAPNLSRMAGFKNTKMPK